MPEPEEWTPDQIARLDALEEQAEEVVRLVAQLMERRGLHQDERAAVES